MACGFRDKLWVLMITLGLQDYLAALKIEPTDKNIEQDVEKIRRIIQGNE